MQVSKIVCVVLLLGLSAPTDAEEMGVPLVGTDQYGNSIEVMSPKEVFSASVSDSIRSVEGPALVALNKTEATRSSLRTVSVGLAASGEINVGVLKVSATPRMRFVFSNSRDPILP